MKFNTILVSCGVNKKLLKLLRASKNISNINYLDVSFFNVAQESVDELLDGVEFSFNQSFLAKFSNKIFNGALNSSFLLPKYRTNNFPFLAFYDCDCKPLYQFKNVRRIFVCGDKYNANPKKYFGAMKNADFLLDLHGVGVDGLGKKVLTVGEFIDNYVCEDDIDDFSNKIVIGSHNDLDPSKMRRLLESLRQYSFIEVMGDASRPSFAKKVILSEGFLEYTYLSKAKTVMLSEKFLESNKSKIKSLSRPIKIIRPDMGVDELIDLVFSNTNDEVYDEKKTVASKEAENLFKEIIYEFDRG